MTTTTTTTSAMIRTLRTLLQLTHNEAHLARARVAQARTEAVRQELHQNADHAQTRAAQLTERLRALGAGPPLRIPGLGRVGALVKTGLDQGVPPEEALFGDLALEHQLLDRARYLKVLAQAGEDTATRGLAERLETAHAQTVDWLTTVLAEQALGGPVAVGPTPSQRVAQTVIRLVNLPTRLALAPVTQLATRVQHGGQAARDRAGQLVDYLGALQVEELPIDDYDHLTVRDVVAATKELDIEEINTILRYEQTHKNRRGVVSAAHTRTADLAKDTAGITD